MIEITKAAVWMAIDYYVIKSNLTRPQLALRAGLDQSTLSPGRHARQWPSLKTVIKIMHTIGISMEDYGATLEAAQISINNGHSHPNSLTDVKLTRKMIDALSGNG